MDSKCYTHYLHLVKLEGSVKHDLFVPSRCKSWGCESCRSIKARIVMDFIKRSFAGQTLYMLTFTDDHKGDVLETWKDLGNRWNLFRTWFTKMYGKFQYVRVIEPHKSGGWPHMHVLINVKPNEAKVRSMLKRWRWGYIYDQMEISPTGAAQYVSGYLTKKWPGNLANQMRQETKTRIVQASQSLGAIFSRRSDWHLMNRLVPADERFEYVWDVYKARFINHETGARLVRFTDSFAVESVATKLDKIILGGWSVEAPHVSIEDVESEHVGLIGIQQTLIL